MSRVKTIREYKTIYDSAVDIWDHGFEKIACCDCSRDDNPVIDCKNGMSVDSQVDDLSNSLEKMDIENNSQGSRGGNKRIPRKSYTRVIWTEKEDKLLIRLSSSALSRKWVKISQIIGNKTPSQCNYRYSSLIKKGDHTIPKTEELLDNSEAMDFFSGELTLKYKLLNEEYISNVFKRLKRKKRINPLKNEHFDKKKTPNSSKVSFDEYSQLYNCDFSVKPMQMKNYSTLNLYNSKCLVYS